MMRQNWIVWAVFFVATLLMILYRREISRHSPTPSDTQE